MYLQLEQDHKLYETTQESVLQSPTDLMFQTEIDVDCKQPFEKTLDQKLRPSTRTDFERTNRLKQTLKQLVRRDDNLTLDEMILRKMKSASQSRGWTRVSGVKIAPMRLLIN